MCYSNEFDADEQPADKPVALPLKMELAGCATVRFLNVERLLNSTCDDRFRYEDETYEYLVHSGSEAG
jgi:hypothetical protein